MKRIVIKKGKNKKAKRFLTVLTLMIVAAAMVITANVLIEQKKERDAILAAEEEKRKAYETFLATYPEYCSFLQQAGYKTEDLVSTDFSASNLSGTTAIKGSVVIFKVNSVFTDTSVSFDDVEIVSAEGLSVLSPTIVSATQIGDFTISLKFKDYTQDVTLTITEQQPSVFSAILINKIATVTPDYVAGELSTSPNINYVYGRNGDVSRMEVNATNALEAMFAAAAADGYSLNALSGYREYEIQKGLYEKAGGANQTDTAAPGASEHQSGLTMDITWGENYYSLSQSMKNTPEFEWLSAHCYEYGFVLRYPEGYEFITGYDYEPWHYRYIGTELANLYHSNGCMTLEEFLAQQR